MKTFSCFILLIGLLSTCSNEYAIEKALFECECKIKAKEGKDLRKEILAFEQTLIKHGFLQDNSGESYLSLIDSLGKNTDMFRDNPNFITEIEPIDFNFSVRNMSTCPNISLQDTLTLHHSKLIFTPVFDAVRDAHDLNATVVASAILEHYTAQDFEQGYYKTRLLGATSMFLITERKDKGITVKFPPWSEEEAVITTRKKRNILSILVNAENQLIVRGELAKVEDLKERAKEFIMNPDHREDLAESPTQAIISLRNDRGTKYAAYLEVYNTLKTAYEELWDELAQQKYGTEYTNDMPIAQRREIRSQIPFVISEAEPTDFGKN